MSVRGWGYGPVIEWDEDPETGCWLWTGARSAKGGYGDVSVNGIRFRAHRLIYEWERGPIPDGLILDHLCCNPPCVNPDHMEPVTNRENILRGRSPTAKNARRTHCHLGHELTPENSYAQPGRGGRACRTCAREHDRRRRLKQKEKRKEQTQMADWKARAEAAEEALSQERERASLGIKQWREEFEEMRAQRDFVMDDRRKAEAALEEAETAGVRIAQLEQEAVARAEAR